MSSADDVCNVHSENHSEIKATGEEFSSEKDKIIDPQPFANKCTTSISNDVNKHVENDKVQCIPTEIQPENSEDVLCEGIVSDSKSTKNLNCDDQPYLKETKVYGGLVYPCVPKINCAEKIIFCLDMSSDMDQIPFKLGDGSQHSPLSMIKRTIELFVENKHLINSKHEYSIMALYEEASWIKEFTNDPKDIIECLEDLNETQACNSCDLSSIVSSLNEKYELGIPNKFCPVRHVFRVILIYGRSSCMINFSDEENRHILMKYPLIFLDVIYIHEPPSSENKCEEIFEALCDLDELNKSYIFEVTRNTTKLHNYMAKLLAHPFQRVAQKDSYYKIRMTKHQGLS